LYIEGNVKIILALRKELKDVHSEYQSIFLFEYYKCCKGLRRFDRRFGGA